MTRWFQGGRSLRIAGFWHDVAPLNVAAHAEPGVFDVLGLSSGNRRLLMGRQRPWVSACGKGFSPLSTRSTPQAEWVVTSSNWSLMTTVTSLEKAIANTKRLIEEDEVLRASRRGGYADFQRRAADHNREEGYHLSGLSLAQPFCAIRRLAM